MNMNIRASVFWLKDELLGGGVVRSHVSEIKQHLNSNTALENVKQLQHILNWSVDNVDFYKPYKDFKSINDFPVINKITIRENEKQFLANGFDKEKLFKEETSGSTGTPLVVYQDAAKRKRAAADTIAFSDFAGYSLGTKLYYSRVWNSHNRKGKLQAKIQNIIMQDSDKLSDDELQKFLDKLQNDSSEKSVLIFASTLSALSQYIKKQKIQPKAKIQCFITMSESLPEEVRKHIAIIFNTTVVSRYSDCECGIIAQQGQNCDEYHINTASFYVELLKLDSDQPATEGEMGRIVVTDLYNHAMPLIRYDTGDVGIMSTSSDCEIGSKVFKRVDGRRIDCVYSTNGEMLSPYIINNTLWRFTELKQYQFIQNGSNDYTIKLNKFSDEFTREQELIDSIKQYIGDDANIKVEYVNEIPLLASGKRKQVICNYNNGSNEK